jgi:hypothetical protein
MSLLEHSSCVSSRPNLDFAASLRLYIYHIDLVCFSVKASLLHTSQFLVALPHQCQAGESFAAGANAPSLHSQRHASVGQNNFEGMQMRKLAVTGISHWIRAVIGQLLGGLCIIAYQLLLLPWYMLTAQMAIDADWPVNR